MADRGFVVQGGVTTLGIVPAFDVLEDGQARLDPGGEAPAVEELALERREETLAQGVVVGVALRGPDRTDGSPGSARRWPIAMFRASRTSSVRRCPAIAQPTTRRLQASSTTARKRKPAQVGMYVMSATHSRSGPSTLKARWTRSGAGQAAGSPRVVVTKVRRLTPTKPAASMRRATRLRPTWTPWAFSSAWIRGVP
jgi:hypothetical protein